MWRAFGRYGRTHGRQVERSPINSSASRCMVLVSVSLYALVVQAGTATVSLPNSANTSAGVFDSQDRLIRTLWSGRFYASQSITLDWDGLDDEGMPAQKTKQ